MHDVLGYFDNLILVRDREQLIDEIELVKREIFAVHSATELEESLQKQLPNSRAKEFFLYLSKQMKHVYDGHVVEEILESLRGKLMDMDVVSVILATDLSRPEISEMHARLVSLVEKRILMQIHTEQSLLGGLKLEYNGIYLDLSLATTIKRMLKQQL